MIKNLKVKYLEPLEGNTIHFKGSLQVNGDINWGGEEN